MIVGIIHPGGGCLKVEGCMSCKKVTKELTGEQNYTQRLRQWHIDGSDKKILILDNHDDFGGHAKRSEHHIDGDMRLSYGGSEALGGTTRFDEVLRPPQQLCGIAVLRTDRVEWANKRCLPSHVFS